MVQKATTRRGRPPTFDRDAVIDAAMAAFYQSGYEATTLPDLEKATGLDRSSLYNSFGGKRGLYEAATRSYLDRFESALVGPLLVGTDDGYADLLAFLSNLRAGLMAAEAIPGCLIVNDMAAGADPEAAQRYRSAMEGGLRRALERTGDPDDTRRNQRAALLAASVIGANLVSKTTEADVDEVGRNVDAIIAEVLRWRAETVEDS